MNNNNIIVPPPSHQLPNQPNQSMAMAPQMVHQMTQLNVYQAHYRAQLQLRAQQAQAQAQAQMAHQAQMTPQMGQRTVSQASSCTATPLLTPQQTPMHTPTPEQLKQKEMMDRICWETFLVEGDVSKEVTVHGKDARDWAARSIRQITKTTRKYGCFDEFHEAIVSASAHSRCCPARNDKQPGGYGRSNMFVLKLFRFPWLKWDMQIKSTRFCRYPFDNDRPDRQVCLNPYHYKRMQGSKEPIPPIVVNKNGNYGEPPIRPEDPLTDWIVAEQNVVVEERLEYCHVPNITMKGDEMKMYYSQHAFDPNDPLDDFPMPAPTDIQSNIALGNIRPDAAYSMAQAQAPAQCAPPQANNVEDKAEEDVSSYQSGLSSPASEMAFSPDVFVPAQNHQTAVLFEAHGNVEEQEKAPEVKEVVEEQKDPEPMESSEPMEQESTQEAPPDPSELEFEAIPAELTPLQSIAAEQDDDKAQSPVISAVPVAMNSDSDSDNDEMMDMDDDDEGRSSKRPKRSATPCEPKPLYRSSVAELAALAKTGTYECVEYEEMDHWLGIVYFEEADQIGDYRAFSRHHCLIDGFMSQDEEPTRYSVGFYSNPKRTAHVSEVRSMIGKGCRLYLLAGEVYVENLCSIPIFVQSISANLKNGFQLNTVNKLTPRSTMKVFDMKIFSRALAMAAEKTYNDVFALSRLCTIRISFCKGWGTHYRRSTVLRAPVWFQAHFHSPMRWIDSVLNSMGAPPRTCSSRT